MVDAAVVGELAEAPFAVADADAAVAEPAERQGGAADMDDTVVDGDAAGLEPDEEPADVSPRATVDVEGERRGARFDQAHRLFNLLVDQNRKHRPENFLLHDLGVGRDVDEHCRRDVTPRGVDLPAGEDGRPAGPRFVDQPADPLGMSSIDDSLKIGGVGRRCPVFLVNRLLNGLEEGRLLRRVDQDVVRGDADLAGVDEFGPDQATSSHRRIRRFIYHHRRLAPQLQRHAARMRRRRSHHELPHRGRPREINVVKRLLQHGLRHLDAPLNARHLLGREDGLHNLGAHRRNVRREFRWLEHHRAAGRNRRHHGAEQQLQRIIPWGHHEHHALRLRAHPTRRAHHRQSPRHPLLAHPPTQAAPDRLELRLEHIDFGEVDLFGGLLEIGVHRGTNVVAPALDFGVKTVESRDAILCGQGALGGLALLQNLKQRGNL